MKSDEENHIDYEYIAADLESAGELMSSYLKRLNGLIAIRESNLGTLPQDLPTEFKISYNELYMAYLSGERALKRHLDIYPELMDEWIPQTFEQMKMLYETGLRNFFFANIRVLQHCASIVRKKAGIPATKHDKQTQYYLGDVHMGDKYLAGQVGAMGKGAHAQDMNFQQIWNLSSDNINLTDLASELSVLVKAMRRDASIPEHEISIVNVAAAEKTAADGPLTLKYLKCSGQLALEAAQKVGVGVAVAAIKSSLGL